MIGAGWGNHRICGLDVAVVRSLKLGCAVILTSWVCDYE